MTTQIFVNLPVKDLPRATEFYKALGYEQNPEYSDENASCIVVSDTIIVMLLTEQYFSTFTGKPVSDASAQTEVILAVSAESKDAVDSLAAKAVAAGGSEPRAPSDLGFMYSRAFHDLDGHLWETAWMDPNAAEE
jgi:predicted lactoylglutathione lyase